MLETQKRVMCTLLVIIYICNPFCKQRITITIIVCANEQKKIWLNNDHAGKSRRFLIIIIL